MIREARREDANNATETRKETRKETKKETKKETPVGVYAATEKIVRR